MSNTLIWLVLSVTATVTLKLFCHLNFIFINILIYIVKSSTWCKVHLVLCKIHRRFLLHSEASLFLLKWLSLWVVVTCATGLSLFYVFCSVGSTIYIILIIFITIWRWRWVTVAIIICISIEWHDKSTVLS